MVEIDLFIIVPVWFGHSVRHLYYRGIQRGKRRSPLSGVLHTDDKDRKTEYTNRDVCNARISIKTASSFISYYVAVAQSAAAMLLRGIASGQRVFLSTTVNK